MTIWYALIASGTLSYDNGSDYLLGLASSPSRCLQLAEEQSRGVYQFQEAHVTELTRLHSGESYTLTKTLNIVLLEEGVPINGRNKILSS